MQAGVDRWLGADLAKEVGGKSVANGDFGTDDPNASRWSCGGPGKSRIIAANQNDKPKVRAKMPHCSVMRLSALALTLNEIEA